MKKWLIGGLLCSTLMMGMSAAYAAEHPSTDAAQTGVTIQLARPIGPGKLPGGESSGGTGGSNATIHTNSNASANVNAQMNVAIGSSSAGRLPHTNGEKNLMYSILGGVLLGCSLCLLLVRKNKEKEVEE
ncbi:LPXTG cell wall anchor domain-containing protein [Enterococcus faecalis]|uniref:LPXTG cell wall anchor domain-containing protein n=1 Tax=Enterococcus faecalis TaxID=1351 RepID=UPI001A97714E|nr:LPXTG cell wall anchor domain-containing protein [Enterococcus faecalis]MBO1106622.1 LPXTG cell wall anchor domain-containing protein [Enterococcus faecalis]